MSLNIKNTNSNLSRWNILVYLAADNNLEEMMVKNVIDLEEVGSNQDMNIIAQLDRGDYPSSVSDKWQGCKRFFIEKDQDRQRINSPVIKDFGKEKVNMSDPKILKEFLVESLQNYPALHTFLVLNNHGAGWLGAMEDESHDNGENFMKLTDIKKAIQDAEKITGKKIDLIGFDACLMGQTEVAYQLKNLANYFVASQETIGVLGWPYIGILSSRLLKTAQNILSSKAPFNPKDFARKAVEESKKNQEVTPTMSALDLSKLNSLKETANLFAQAILDTDTHLSKLREAVKKSMGYGGFKPYSDSRDLIGFAENILEDKTITDNNLRKSAQDLIELIKKEVLIAEEHSPAYQGSNGLSIYLPLDEIKRGYNELDWALNTKWQEVYRKLAGENYNEEPEPWNIVWPKLR
ncbi:MAG: hypothetical protein HYU63_04955 [Armatimonadetes bacterium]|nr:hypothetical protein [Armatimonadota bacterium]